jgi:hypothetical protein
MLLRALGQHAQQKRQNARLSGLCIALLCCAVLCCAVLQPETTQKLKVVGLGMPDNHGGLVYWVRTAVWPSVVPLLLLLLLSLQLLFSHAGRVLCCCYCCSCC